MNPQQIIELLVYQVAFLQIQLDVHARLLINNGQFSKERLEAEVTDTWSQMGPEYYEMIKKDITLQVQGILDGSLSFEQRMQNIREKQAHWNEIQEKMKSPPEGEN